MFRPRLIPVLLLKKNGLVKTVKFKNPKYVGDPINAVKIFNDFYADELVFLDILATKENRCVSLDLVKNIGKEANMPFAVGGGIRNVGQIRDILSAGAEKVVMNSSAFENPDFIIEAVNTFGSSTIVASVDVGNSLLGGKKVFINAGKKNTKKDPINYTKHLESLGVGEIIVNTIYNDGMMGGYDIELLNTISQNLSIPVVACGGAGSYEDFTLAVEKGYCSAVAAGSLFVFHGPRKAVLINYPQRSEITKIFNEVSL